MPRTLEKVMPVRVTSDKVNRYSTIERACISAVTACMCLGDEEHAKKFMTLKEWAATNYREQVETRFDELDDEQ